MIDSQDFDELALKLKLKGNHLQQLSTRLTAFLICVSRRVFVNVLPSTD